MSVMTVTDIFTRVKRSFGDEAGIQVVESDVINWINDAQREAVMQHEGLLMTESLLSSVVGQQEYSVPNNCFTIQHIYYKYSNDWYEVNFVPASELNDRAPGWLGSTTGYPVVFTKLLNNKILFYPAPNEAGSNNIRVVHSRYPTVLTTNSDPIDLPEYYHSYVEHFCMMKAYEKDEDWEASDRKAQLVQSTLNENLFRESWFGRETYPKVVDFDE